MKLDTVVLQVGELSETVPEYLYKYFPMVCYKTTLEGAKLEIETTPALGLCQTCGKQFNIVENDLKKRIKNGIII